MYLVAEGKQAFTSSCKVQGQRRITLGDLSYLTTTTLSRDSFQSSALLGTSDPGKLSVIKLDQTPVPSLRKDHRKSVEQTVRIKQLRVEEMRGGRGA